MRAAALPSLLLPAALLAAAAPAAAQEPGARADAARDRELESLRARVEALEEQAERTPAPPASATEPATATAAPAKGLSGYDRILLQAFVDVYYGYSTNRPGRGDARANFIPGTGSTARNDARFDPNLAAIDVSLAPDPAGFRLAAVYGTGTQVLRFGDPAGDGSLSRVSAVDLICVAMAWVEAPIGEGLLCGVVASY